MRKMVPDPPYSLDATQALQDTLVQSSIVMQAVIQEMEAVQGLVESALMQLQMRPHVPSEPYTLH